MSNNDPIIINVSEDDEEFRYADYSDFNSIGTVREALGLNKKEINISVSVKFNTQKIYEAMRLEALRQIQEGEAKLTIIGGK